MACNCTKRKAQKFLWYKNEGTLPVIYDTEIQAKAKVLRQGGTYVPYDPAVPLASQMTAVTTGR